jgi:uncharacterized protein YbjT (DUF2867 family)
MKVILFGASGMVGQGALRECLQAPDVEKVLSVSRRPLGGPGHPKLEELVHEDLSDLTAVEGRLSGYDACFFCVGVTSAGLSEEAYRKVTVGLTLAAARPLARLNPRMTFVFVSGMGADSTGTSRTMWARVKGEAENAVLALPFRAAYVFRPAFIRPLHGIQSRTRAYRVLYPVLAPFVPLLERVAPGVMTTTEAVGRAMLEAVRHGAPKRVLENADVHALGTRAG